MSTDLLTKNYCFLENSIDLEIIYFLTYVNCQSFASGGLISIRYDKLTKQRNLFFPTFL